MFLKLYRQLFRIKKNVHLHYLTQYILPFIYLIKTNTIPIYSSYYLRNGTKGIPLSFCVGPYLSVLHGGIIRN